MTKSSGFFTNKRGNKLYTAAWLPENEEVKAVLFWHHGLGEYIERMDPTASYWASAGIAVYGYDAHGHGQSEPQDEPSRVLVKRFNHLVDDAVQFLTEVVQPAMAAKHVAAPLFIGGNSLGGLVASYVVLARPEAFAGLLLQSPAMDVEWTPILRVQAAVGGLLAALVPRAKLVPAVRPEDMSQDPAVVKAYLEDPQIYKGNVKALTGNEILKGFRALTSKRHHFKLPIYATHGTSDRCTSLPALRTHLKHVKSDDVTLKEVEGGYHELLHGPEADTVQAEIKGWVLARAAAGKAAPAAGPEAAPAAKPEAPAASAAAGAGEGGAPEAVASPEAVKAAV